MNNVINYGAYDCVNGVKFEKKINKLGAYFGQFELSIVGLYSEVSV